MLFGADAVYIGGEAFGLRAKAKNFDKESIESRIRATLTEKEVLLKQVTNLTVLPEAAKWNGSENWEEKARTVGVLSTENEDIRSLRESRRMAYSDE